MTQEVADQPKLYETPLRNLKGGQYIYYRQPNGWITFGSGQKMDASNYQEGGWRPLPRYGDFVLNQSAINHPYDLLFRKGGAKEMPLDQLIEEGWAYNNYELEMVPGDPTTRQRVEFPQLVGVTLPQLERCHHCGRKGTHAQIANHEEVQHQKDLAPQKMAEALGQALAGKSTDLKAETQQPSPFNYICGQCSQGFTHPMALAKHVKGEHK